MSRRDRQGGAMTAVYAHDPLPATKKKDRPYKERVLELQPSRDQYGCPIEDVRHRSIRETVSDLISIHRAFVRFLEMSDTLTSDGLLSNDAVEARGIYRSLCDDCLTYHGWTAATWSVALEAAKAVGELGTLLCTRID